MSDGFQNIKNISRDYMTDTIDTVKRRRLPSEPIVIPEVHSHGKAPFLLRFVEQPTFQNQPSDPRMGGSTYMGTTPAGNGETGDYVNDDR